MLTYRESAVLFNLKNLALEQNLYFLGPPKKNFSTDQQPAWQPAQYSS